MTFIGILFLPISTAIAMSTDDLYLEYAHVNTQIDHALQQLKSLEQTKSTLELEMKIRAQKEELEKKDEQDEFEKEGKFFIDEWHEVKAAIEKNNLKYKLMKLHYEPFECSYFTLSGPSLQDEDSQFGFVNKETQPLFSTAVTPEPIIIGYSRKAKTPYMFIRFQDSNHNKKSGLPEGVKSFIVITLGVVPHCGVEQFMQEYRYMIDQETRQIGMLMNTEFNMDNGVWITNHIVKLMNGEIEGMKVM
ncbi:MAG: hypothetical protein MUO21_00615 [Nitrososphaeraceae archaeon]|nr:hypothetical protein [Nitrososphaeraceae archaeon]